MVFSAKRWDCISNYALIEYTTPIHDLKELAFLSQLQVGISKLNFHRFRHNFGDNEVENA